MTKNEHVSHLARNYIEFTCKSNQKTGWCHYFTAVLLYFLTGVSKHFAKSPRSERNKILNNKLITKAQLKESFVKRVVHRTP